MCLMLYLGSDVPLPIINWEPEHPPLHVADLDDHDRVVSRHFSKPHVYYVGAHGGCGCVFEACDLSAELPEDHETFRPGEWLRDLTLNALQHQSSVEFFACWDGDQDHDIDHRAHVTSDELVRSERVFLEKQFVVCEK